MTSKDHAYLQSVVPQLVLNYQLTSKSRKLTKLTNQNVNKIIKSINQEDSKKKYLLELIGKKDHYIQKINKFLHDNAPNDDEYIPEDVSQDSKLDPKYISNRYLAQKYIRQNVLNNKAKYQILKDTINKHYKFQKTMKEDREQMIQKFTERKKSLFKNGSTGLQKLVELDNTIMNNKLEKMQKDFDKELAKYDEYVYYKMKNLVNESSSSMIQLNIPFFCISSDYEYPSLDKDKEFIVEYINGIVSKDLLES